MESNAPVREADEVAVNALKEIATAWPNFWLGPGLVWVHESPDQLVIRLKTIAVKALSSLQTESTP